ncbi:MAG: hypothetical protein HRU15_03740 [Planctomycetes bacterium]|nr:hypothetical protein [Planctomycetota bacterium]
METRYLISLNYWDLQINKSFRRFYTIILLVIIPFACGIYFRETPYVLAGSILFSLLFILSMYLLIIWSKGYDRLAIYRSVIYDSSFSQKDLLYQLLIAVEQYEGHDMEDNALVQLVAKETDTSTVDLDDVPKPALIILIYLSSHRFLTKRVATQLIYELQAAIAQYKKTE